MKLLTLNEVSRATGISMPTLQRYVELFPRRIPSIGEGQASRFGPEAIAALRTIHREQVEDDPAHGE